MGAVRAVQYFCNNFVVTRGDYRFVVMRDYLLFTSSRAISSGEWGWMTAHHVNAWWMGLDGLL